MGARWLVVAIPALIGVGCSSEPAPGLDDDGGGGAGTFACAAGQTALDDGTCLDAGTQPDGCAAGEWSVEGLGCVAAGDPGNGCAAGEVPAADGCDPAGVPPDGCGEGFVHDGDGGCDPVIAPICAAGLMANLGETTCRAVTPCGSGPWGDIAVDADTIYVDAAATGPGDGSATSPYPSVQTAIDAAPDGALVAIGAGTYVEDLLVDKQLRLRGKCPDEVTIQGTDVAVTMAAGASQAALGGLGITSDGAGILLSGASDVALEQLWVHDTAGRGIEAEDAPPQVTSLTLRDSLIEKAVEYGVILQGADATIERIVVRDTAALGTHGWGLTLQIDEQTGKTATYVADNVVLDRNAENGGVVYAANATIDGLLVRDTQPNDSNRFGRGFAIQNDGLFRPGADVQVRHAVVEGASDAGFLVSGAMALLENVVVRDVDANLDEGIRGYGIAAQDAPGARAELTVRGALIEQASESGLFLSGLSLDLEGVLSRNNLPVDSGFFGRGASIQNNPAFPEERSSLTMRGCRFEDNRDAAVFAQGVDAVFEGLAIHHTSPNEADGTNGIGLVLQDDKLTGMRASGEISGTVVEDSHYAGVFAVGSDVRVERVDVTGITPVGSDGFGRGINIHDNVESFAPASATVVGSRVDGAFDAGIMLAGGDYVAEGLLVENTQGGNPTYFGARGINVQNNPQTGESAMATVSWSVVRGSTGGGLVVGNASVTAQGLVIEHTDPIEDLFGDGVAVVAIDGPTQLSLAASRVDGSARAGISNFGGFVELGTSVLECNDVSLAYQDLAFADAAFDDLGGNLCACSQTSDGSTPTSEGVCKVLSPDLSPPAAIDAGAF
jgi:hypothetical protein